MNAKLKLPLTKKLALAIVVTGLVPAVVIGFLAIHTAGHLAEDIGSGYERIAANICDKIDRNLFERYGDVQAFGVNDAVNDHKSWYQPGSDKNRIAAAANHYANLYGFYLLSYLVDLDGKVVAVNDQNPDGKPIDTAWLYEKNFKDAEWFKESLAGHFLKSDSLDGTYVQDLHADEDVKKAYNNDGLVLGFSAPVKDATGKTIGVWHNCANFSLVEEIVATAYRSFKDKGDSEAEITLLDHTGRVIVDYDPATQGSEAVKHNPDVLLKLNLATEGLEPAKQLVAGKSGHGDFTHARKSIREVTGYAASTGALGFPGLHWGVLARVPEKQALVAMHSQLWNIGFVILGSIAGLIAMGVWLGRSISRPLMAGISSMNHVGQEVAHASQEFSVSSQTVAEGASEQAASLEETSASLEEIASMTKRNSENATSAASLGRQSRESAAAGLERINELTHTLNAIKSAVGEMQAAVSEMQTSSQQVAKIIKTIDEIAFQTNLLALNAAVEAARAGEAGMGFAVVADEVRALAQRSAQAAKDTSEKIEAAVKRSELGGVASAKVVKSLTEVEVTAQSIQQVFTGIVTQIKSLDEVIAEIAAASKEQSQGVGEVNMAVSQMDKVTQSNAAAAEENAAAAGEMNSQARTLQEVVSELETVVSGRAVVNVALAAGPAQPAPHRSRSVANLPSRLAQNRTPAKGSQSIEQQIKKAIGAHGAWKRRLQDAVQNGYCDKTPEQTEPDNQCEFGKWLYSLPAAERDPNHWSQVRGLHANFHREAASVLRQALHGQKEAAESSLDFGGNYANISSELTEAMKAWEHDVSGHSLPSVTRESSPKVADDFDIPMPEADSSQAGGFKDF